jgi:hypothetical protein
LNDFKNAARDGSRFEPREKEVRAKSVEPTLKRPELQSFDGLDDAPKNPVKPTLEGWENV